MKTEDQGGTRAENMQHCDCSCHSDQVDEFCEECCDGERQSTAREIVRMLRERAEKLRQVHNSTGYNYLSERATELEYQADLIERTHGLMPEGE
jgi:hypothetical protein